MVTWRIQIDSELASVVVDVPMQPDPSRGSVSVELKTAGLDGMGEFEPRILLRRLPGDSERQRWEWFRARSLDRASGTALIGLLVPGAYELYAWLGTELVGRTRVDVVGGRTASARVELRPGLMVDLRRGEHSQAEDAWRWASVRLRDGCRLRSL